GEVVEDVEGHADVVRRGREVRIELRDVATLGNDQLPLLGRLGGDGPGRSAFQNGRRGCPDTERGSALQEGAARETACLPRVDECPEIHGLPPHTRGTWDQGRLDDRSSSSRRRRATRLASSPRRQWGSTRSSPRWTRVMIGGSPWRRACTTASGVR